MTPEQLVHLVLHWTVAGFACVVIVAFIGWLALQLVLMIWDA
jgi:hypothetical protein